MPLGLGRYQRLILDTLLAIEAERGPGPWRVAYVLTEAYERSSVLQSKEAAREAARVAGRERMRQAAKFGGA